VEFIKSLRKGNTKRSMVGTGGIWRQRVREREREREREERREKRTRRFPSNNQ
jgi:hypothetical protein